MKIQPEQPSDGYLFEVSSNFCETGCCFRLNVTTENSKEIDVKDLCNLLKKFTKQVASGEIKIPRAHDGLKPEQLN